MRYRNIETGFIHDFNCEIKSKNWEALAEESKPLLTEKAEEPKKTVKKTTKKK